MQFYIRAARISMTGGGNNISLRSDDYVQKTTDSIHGTATTTTNVYFKRGFILDTNTGESYANHVSIEGTGYFYFKTQTAALNASTNKPYMPMGDMTLNYVKFEYKEVE